MAGDAQGAQVDSAIVAAVRSRDDVIGLHRAEPVASEAAEGLLLGHQGAPQVVDRFDQGTERLVLGEAGGPSHAGGLRHQTIPLVGGVGPLRPIGADGVRFRHLSESYNLPDVQARDSLRVCDGHLS